MIMAIEYGGNSIIAQRTCYRRLEWFWLMDVPKVRSWPFLTVLMHYTAKGKTLPWAIHCAARGIAAGYAHRHLSNNPICYVPITDRLDGLDRFKGTYPRFVML